MEAITELTKLVQRNHQESQSAFQQLGDRLAKVEDVVVSMDKRLAMVEDVVVSMDKRLAVVEEKVSTIDRRLATVEENVLTTDRRLIRVEERNIAIDEKLGGLTDRAGGQEARMWALALAIVALLGSALVKVFALPA